MSNLSVSTYGLPFRSTSLWYCPPVTWSVDSKASFPVIVSVVDYADYLEGKITMFSNLGTWALPGGIWMVPEDRRRGDGKEVGILFVDTTGARAISGPMKIADASKEACMYYMDPWMRASVIILWFFFAVIVLFTVAYWVNQCLPAGFISKWRKWVPLVPRQAPRRRWASHRSTSHERLPDLEIGAQT